MHDRGAGRFGRLRVTTWRLVAATTLLIGSAPALAADYVLIRKEILVERPADTVWRRVGGFCAIADWLKLKCELVSGSGDVGSIRRLNGEIEEPMVGRTVRSYTYGQTKGAMAGFDYHGTLAVEPEGPTRARILYTITYDAARMPSDAVRKAQFERIGPRFQAAIEAMKVLAEAQP
ncbi:MAG: hypothetical protein JWL91_1408 [Sphingomonas bacterium]|nr:hypothetical protein [Sphingomonas bacterium]